MPNKHGDFIWYELMTNDADAAQYFYEKILGWTFQDAGQEGMDYRTFSAKAESIGGFMTLTNEMKTGGAQPCWLGYINVDDVDASAKSIKNAGGSVHMGPQDIPDVGRIAFVADPQDTMFYIMKPKPPADKADATSNAFAYDKPIIGHCAWHELATSDQDAGIVFYTGQFGWEQKDEMDMGPIGKYKFLYHGKKMIGAAMTRPEEMPISVWTYYFRVPDIDKAVKLITKNGGERVSGPHEIPGGEFTVSAIDPQGANFALVGGKKS